MKLNFTPRQKEWTLWLLQLRYGNKENVKNVLCALDEIASIEAQMQIVKMTRGQMEREKAQSKGA